MGVFKAWPCKVANWTDTLRTPCSQFQIKKLLVPLKTELGKQRDFTAVFQSPTLIVFHPNHEINLIHSNFCETQTRKKSVKNREYIFISNLKSPFKFYKLWNASIALKHHNE